jgi:NAD(P)-dependent dehydrogenase (short-subunit alcohol dehydrogenase family)
VLVTGASSGMGEDAALHLNELGYRVIATVRRDQDADRLHLLAVEPDAFHTVLLDVGETDHFDRALAEVRDILGDHVQLVGLFSNAGVAAFTGDLSCELCPLETQQWVMNVNFFGAVRVVQTFLPLVREARGTVVLNSALMAHTVLPFNAGYAASKFALEGFADGLRRETRSQRVRVVIIEAAAISTSLDAKQDPARVPAGGLYPAQRPMTELFLAMQRKREHDPVCSPRRVSELVAHAIQSPHPRTRYRVGGGAKPIYVMGLLPDKVQDRLFTTALKVIERRSRLGGVDHTGAGTARKKSRSTLDNKSGRRR